ncbi:MAG: aminotransferase class I/II-fold pyridoxal phosphate-dependent enzyme [Candidatus Eisenbacteria bacterium]|nr:aminotransferase class I/II-fold pyridoxal phosphate-dependent enzyme [Candidatus Eisenbacteria bacterium]
MCIRDRGHAARLRTELRALGYDVAEGRVPIVPVVVGEEAPALALSQALLARGVFAQAIRPPTVPRGTARLRVVPIASHSTTDLDHAIGAFADAKSAVEGA